MSTDTDDIEQDRREQVIARLVEIAGSVEGIEKVIRNPASGLSDDKRPAITIYDGDEEAASDPVTGRPGRAPRLVAMRPEIYIQLGDLPENVGTKLNEFRRKMVKAVCTDSTLAAILGANGSVLYDGCATALTRGRQVEGEISLGFVFVYVLNPTKL